MRKPRAAEAVPPLVVSAGEACTPVLRVISIEGRELLKLRCPVCCSWARLDLATATGLAAFSHARFRVPGLEVMCGYVATRDWVHEVQILES